MNNLWIIGALLIAIGLNTAPILALAGVVLLLAIPIMGISNRVKSKKNNKDETEKW